MMASKQRGKQPVGILVAVFLTLFVCRLCLFFTGVSLRPDPPTAEEAKAFLTRHRDDIGIVVEYLKDLDQDDASIKYIYNHGTVFYDYVDHDVSSKEVTASLRRLWFAGCTTIGKNDNTISFMIWTHIIYDVDCGIACTIDGQGTPKTEFQTKLKQIGDGWFYYYDDYEEYRAHPSKYEENQPWAVP